ncbi:MAG: phage tail tape measure protein [Bacteroidales bacterium]|nr:phage tail tape measure protein [Bacteroidales bacterium]MBN2748467.1 phage tail tape measure protein [Bacteroidales bacterium]
MTTVTQWILELVDKITAPMKDIAGASEEAAKGVEDVGAKADESGKKLKGMSAIDLRAIGDSVRDLADMFSSLNAPGAEFDAQLKEIKAITGVTGDALDQLGLKARKTARDFGGDASKMMESYKSVLSRLGPDIASSQDALDLMGRNIATLSKTMNDDSVGAMDALTTAMLQFGVDLSDPVAAADEMSRMMNVMAAGAKEGASEVPQIADALKQAGVQALDSKVSFEETNAALQALAQGGKYGSEAGIALRNVLGKMAGLDVIPKEAVAKLQALGVNYDVVSDKTIPLTDRLKELQKAQGDATIMAQIFGTENAAAANILIRSTDYQLKLTEAITGTNVATEQADIIMSGYNQTISRVSAWFDDLKIRFFGVTSAITPFVEGMAGAVSIMANFANAKQGVVLLFNTLKTMPVVGSLVSWASGIMSAGFATASAGAHALGVAIMSIPIIGWIAAIIAALIAVGVYLYKTSATFRGVLMGVWNFIKVMFTGWYKFIWEVMQAILHVIKGVFNPKNWFDPNYKFSDAFDKVVGAAKQYGSDLAGAYAEGKAEGEESFYKDNPDKRPGAKEQKAKVGAVGSEIKNVSPRLSQSDLGAPSASGGTVSSGLGGSGGGGSSIKHITQKIDMKNYFTLSADSTTSDVDGIAERVVRAINDKLRDGLIAAT